MEMDDATATRCIRVYEPRYRKTDALLSPGEGLAVVKGPACLVCPVLLASLVGPLVLSATAQQQQKPELVHNVSEVEGVDGATAIRLPAETAWVDSGVYLCTGDRVAISASGRIYVGNISLGQPSISNYQTPAGTLYTTAAEQGKRISFIAPALVPWSLVGRVGVRTAPFYLGNALDFTADHSGELYVSVNDNNFADNSGSWNVFVRVTKAKACLQVSPEGRILTSGSDDHTTPRLSDADALKIGSLNSYGAGKHAEAALPTQQARAIYEKAFVHDYPAAAFSLTDLAENLQGKPKPILASFAVVGEPTKPAN
jgi:hypothetical protein